MPEPTTTDPSQGRHGPRRFLHRMLWATGVVVATAVARELAIRRNDRTSRPTDHRQTNSQS